MRYEVMHIEVPERRDLMNFKVALPPMPKDKDFADLADVAKSINPEEVDFGFIEEVFAAMGRLLVCSVPVPIEMKDWVKRLSKSRVIAT